MGSSFVVPFPALVSRTIMAELVTPFKRGRSQRPGPAGAARRIEGGGVRTGPRPLRLVRPRSPVDHQLHELRGPTGHVRALSVRPGGSPAHRLRAWPARSRLPRGAFDLLGAVRGALGPVVQAEGH